MKLFLVLFTCLLCLSSLTYCQIRINGKAQNFKNKQIFAKITTDYLSEHKKIVANSLIDGDGKFELQFSLRNTRLVEFYINQKYFSLYCEPEHIYNITVNGNGDLNSKEKIFCKQSFPKSDELNQLIISFNNSFYDLLENNKQLFIAKREGTLIRSFVAETREKYQGSENKYFKMYLKYNLAMIEESTLNNDQEIYQKYFANGPVQIENSEYMKLFKQFYQKRFENLITGGKGLKFLGIIRAKDYGHMIAQLKEDKYVGSNDSLAELIALYGFMETYYNDEILEKKEIENMTQKIIKEGIFPTVAENILFELNYLTKGSIAPNFELKSLNNEEINLEKYRGKMIYIQFWTSRSISAIREMILLNSLSQKYSNKVSFLSINLDEFPDDMKKLVKNKSYGWDFAHYASFPQVINDYEVFAPPLYVLVDRSGKILSYPAVSPSDGIEKFFLN